MEYMESKMQDRLEASMSEYEQMEQEIQTLRTKVASAEVLVEALREAILKAKKEYDLHPSKINMDCIAIPLDEALATYDKLSEE